MAKWYAEGDGQYSRNYGKGVNAAISKEAWESEAFWMVSDWNKSPAIIARGESKSLGKAKKACNKAAFRYMGK